ncbi:hypothetical protein [Kribbella deserti]|uniref:Uncharacterized protein n=1 Tax=Kribbella deserti TaxID=1926257 RepID=A0ABV6QG95_9ACTN
MSGEQSTREVATSEVAEYQAVVARWEAEKTAAEAELSDLQARAGEEVLADESAASRLSRSMQELRDRIDIAARAVAAAEPKLAAATRAVILAEAAEWDEEKARRQALLDAHNAKRQELLDALQDFTGLAWDIKRNERALGDVGPRVIEVAPGEKLQREVQRAERTAWCLRELAEGRDPHAELSVPFEGRMFQGVVPNPKARDFYTSTTWGPDALLPAPAYLRAKAAGTADDAPAARTEVPGPPPGWGGVGEVRTVSGERVR